MGGGFQVHALRGKKVIDALSIVEAWSARRGLVCEPEPIFARLADEHEIRLTPRRGGFSIELSHNEEDRNLLLALSALGPLLTTWSHDGDFWGYALVVDGRVATEFSFPHDAYDPTAYFDTGTTTFQGDPLRVAEAFGVPDRAHKIEAAQRLGPERGGDEKFLSAVGLGALLDERPRTNDLVLRYGPATRTTSERFDLRALFAGEPVIDDALATPLPSEGDPKTLSFDAHRMKIRVHAIVEQRDAVADWAYCRLAWWWCYVDCSALRQSEFVGDIEAAITGNGRDTLVLRRGRLIRRIELPYAYNPAARWLSYYVEGPRAIYRFQSLIDDAEHEERLKNIIDGITFF